MSKYFREEDHPRDQDGKFTDGTGQNTSGGSASIHKMVVPHAYKFNRRNTENHMDHANEMKLNQKQYEIAAVMFFNGNEGKIYYSEARGRYYRYDARTQRMAVSSEGKIHTFVLVTQKRFDKIRRQDKLNEI